jgi:WG containing repeat
MPALLTLMAILPLSSCNNNNSTQSISSSDSVKTTTSKNLDRFFFQWNGKWGYIDRTGKIIIPAKFDSAAYFREGLSSVQIGEKWGYIDPMGKIVIPAKFDNAYLFGEGLASVRIGKKWGYIDPTGKIVIPAKFDGAGVFEHGLAYIYTGNESSSFAIDKTGKVVATPSADPAKKAMKGESDGLIAFEEKGKIGYKDRTGKTIIPAKFDRPGFYPGSFNDGLAPVCLKQKCGYIDKTGKIVVPLQFDLIAGKFSDGLAWVNIGQKLGYVNKTGKLVIPARYGKADIGKGICDSRPCLNGTKLVDAYPDFDRGLAVVAIPECKQAGKKNCNRSGYIDTSGKLVFEF